MRERKKSEDSVPSVIVLVIAAVLDTLVGLVASVLVSRVLVVLVTRKNVFVSREMENSKTRPFKVAESVKKKENTANVRIRGPSRRSIRVHGLIWDAYLEVKS